MTIEEAEAHIGDGVVYAPAHGSREDGVITGVRGTYVFVMYAGDLHSKATDPASLYLLAAALTTTKRRRDTMPILTWEGPADQMPDFCPEGCGGVTEDPYGGPCKACWAAVNNRSGDRFDLLTEYRQSTTACCPRQTIPDSCGCLEGCGCLCRDCDCGTGYDCGDDDYAPIPDPHSRRGCPDVPLRHVGLRDRARLRHHPAGGGVENPRGRAGWRAVVPALPYA